jgi:hypothetical protein
MYVFIFAVISHTHACIGRNFFLKKFSEISTLNNLPSFQCRHRSLRALLYFWKFCFSMRACLCHFLVLFQKLLLLLAFWLVLKHYLWQRFHTFLYICVTVQMSLRLASVVLLCTVVRIFDIKQYEGRGGGGQIFRRERRLLHPSL